VKIADKDRKKNYAKELMKELPGILNWALEGCLKWQREGLEKPSPVKAATTDYRNDMDELGEFLKVVCNVSDEAKILSSELYAAYTSWCESNGIRVPQKNRSFSLKLKERGFETVHRSTGNEWQGIGLKEKLPPDSEDDSDITTLF
jgi:putative DNA primase/helicase